MTWPFCEAKSLAIIPEISNIKVLETIAQTFNAVGPLRIEKFYSAASAFLLTKPNFFDPLAEIKAKKDIDGNYYIGQYHSVTGQKHGIVRKFKRDGTIQEKVMFGKKSIGLSRHFDVTGRFAMLVHNE